MKEARLEVKVEFVDEQGKATLVYGTAKIFGEALVKKASEDYMVSEVLASGLNGIRANPNAVKKFKSFVSPEPKVVEEVIEKPEVKPEPATVVVELPNPTTDSPSEPPVPKGSATKATRKKRTGRS